MKIALPTLAAVLALLGTGLAQEASQDPQDPLDARVEALEQEVLALRAETAAQKALLEETTRYLAGAKQRSDDLLKTLDEAQKAGFTAGINYTSREILLAGFREYARGEAADVPGAPPKKKEPEARRY